MGAARASKVDVGPQARRGGTIRPQALGSSPTDDRRGPILAGVRWYPVDEQLRFVRRSALLEEGYDAADLDKALRRKVLVPVQRGLYAPGDQRVNALDRARVSVAAVTGARAVASHRTAARVHGIEVALGGPETVTIPRGERRPHRSGLRYHTSRLGPDDVVEIGGVEVTTVPRTLVDLCRVSADRTRAVWTVEQGMARLGVTRTELGDAIARLARTPGLRRVREWIELAEPASQSPLETAARLALLAAGLPCPELQVRVERADGRTAFLDLAYREARVGIELDGRSEHGMERAVFEDRRRQNQVLATGEWTIFRFTWGDVHERRGEFVRLVARAIGC